ncbi:hypothetical protein FSP39_012236 [Pinctada imbricata]|uniref:Uncharacterized protein n=1 Tax=Pinctada imbricata TaxID=66713 RepID=A0AA88YIZ7_PINIB|nr:hypothetical protein FSP39_012236 [Pinctada imbricata]
MLRLGRGLQMLRLGKRAMPMLRLGRGASDSITQEQIRYIISLLLQEENYDNEPFRRQIPFPRYGKDLSSMQELIEELQRMPSQERRTDMYDLDEDSPRQIRPGPRPGRFRRSTAHMLQPDVSQEEAEVNSVERAPPLPRIGREQEDGEGEEGDIKVPMVKGNSDYYIDVAKDGSYYVADKRGMPMLRLGRGMPMLRLGKRPFKMLRLGRGSEGSDDEKRGMPMLRLGKRPFKMLRLGKRLESDSESDKRAMAMLRLGRNS